MTDAVLLSGPLDMVAYGKDATCWRWFIGGHEVLVEIANTAIESDPEYLHPDVAQAIETKGQSLILGVLDWDVPPREIRCYPNEVVYA